MAGKWRKTLPLILAALVGVTLAPAAWLTDGRGGSGQEASAAITGEADRAASGKCAGPDLDTLFKRMDENGATVRSGHLVVRRQRGTSVVEEEAWFDGERVRVDERTLEPEQRTESMIYDGRRVTELRKEANGTAVASVWEPDEEQPIAWQVYPWLEDLLIAWPLQLSMGHAPPRGSALASRRVWLPRLLGEEQAGGVRCLRLVLLPLGRDLTAVTHESMWVAPERGYAVAKFERHTICPEAEHWYAFGEVWEVQEWMHPVEGLWLPRVTSWRRYEQSLWLGGEPREYSSRSEVTAAEFNCRVPAEVFSVEIPPEAKRYSAPTRGGQPTMGRGRRGGRE